MLELVVASSTCIVWWARPAYLQSNPSWIYSLHEKQDRRKQAEWNNLILRNDECSIIHQCPFLWSSQKVIAYVNSLLASSSTLKTHSNDMQLLFRNLEIHVMLLISICRHFPIDDHYVSGKTTRTDEVAANRWAAEGGGSWTRIQSAASSALTICVLSELQQEPVCADLNFCVPPPMISNCSIPSDAQRQ